MKKNICLLLCFLSITVCFSLTPRSLHISEIFGYLKGKTEQIQVFKSGSYEYYGELLEGEDILLEHTVFDWKNLKTYTIVYTSDGTEIEEYRERTFNNDLLIVQDIWVDCDGELILNYEYASDYSSYKCYAIEDDEQWLYDEYYIKKTAAGYNGFYHNYYVNGDIYSALKCSDPLPYFYDTSKKEFVNKIYCMKYGIKSVIKVEYDDSNRVDATYNYIFSEKFYTVIDNIYEEKYEIFYDDDYYIIRGVEYYDIDDQDPVSDQRNIIEKDSSGRIISEKHYEDVADTDNFNPNIHLPDETFIIKYPKTGLKSLERPTKFYDDDDDEGYFCEECGEYHYY